MPKAFPIVYPALHSTPSNGKREEEAVSTDFPSHVGVELVKVIAKNFTFNKGEHG